MDNFICCFPPVPRWEDDSWEKMFQLHSRNCPSVPQYLASPDCLAAFIRILFGRSRLALVPQYLLPCTLHPSTLLHLVQNVQPRPAEPGASFSYELTGSHGAALVTKYQTYREDSLLESAFERYTKRHYESWVAFARHKQYGDDVRPVLVSGFDMTGDFAMVAYSNESASLESDFTIGVPMLASASASLWGTWRTRCSAHTNYGPQQCSPPPRGRPIDSLSLQQADTGSIPDEFNQCVFIRYYTMRSRKWMFPKVIRAGAGPQDLGSGDNGGNTFPELTAQSDAESTASDDEDLGGQWTPTAGDTDSESDIVVRNIQYVCFFCRALSFLL